MNIKALVTAALLTTLAHAQTSRIATYPVDALFLERWSPRAMSGEAIGKQELMSLFEAARWAPSESNTQPWNFFYVMRDTPEWDSYFNLMVDFNKTWAQHAGALVIIASNSTAGKTHAFDTGAAWQNMALQGSLNGLVVHAMGGFDYDKASRVLKLPKDFTVFALVAVGKPGKVEKLPDYMQKMEKPSSRKPISEFVFEGTYAKK